MTEDDRLRRGTTPDADEVERLQSQRREMIKIATATEIELIRKERALQEANAEIEAQKKDAAALVLYHRESANEEIQETKRAAAAAVKFFQDAEQSVGLESLTKKKGVSMLEAALVLSNDDEDDARTRKDKWVDNKAVPRPKELGKHINSKQVPIFEPAALAKFIENVDGYIPMTIAVFIQRLTAIAKPPRENK